MKAERRESATSPSGRIAMIAIDSLDPGLIRKHRHVLPNFSQLMDAQPSIDLESVYPPDSYPAWRSAFTGKNPAEHGLLFTADAFGSTKGQIEAMTNQGLEGHAFWDDWSRAGRKVCVLFPLTAYPSWPVNGLLVTRSEEVRGDDGVAYRNISVHPEGAILTSDVPDLRGFTGQHPGESGLAAFRDRAMHWAQQDADFALRMARSHEWDLFFAYFPELDTIQHYFWRYCDPADPYHSPSPFQDTILEAYRFFDDLVGRFREAHPGVRLVVVSDHGHRMRPVRTFQLNEWLRRKRWLRIRRRLLPVGMELAKRSALAVARATGTQRLLIRAAQRVPQAKQVYVGASLVHPASRAVASTFRGPKSYAEGGISIRRDDLTDAEYEECRSAIMAGLAESLPRITGDRDALFWVKRREDLYEGLHAHLYPDIVFQLGGDWGIGWDVLGRLTGTSHEHPLSSGGHDRIGCWLDSEGMPGPHGISGTRSEMKAWIGTKKRSPRS